MKKLDDFSDEKTGSILFDFVLQNRTQIETFFFEIASEKERLLKKGIHLLKIFYKIYD